MKVNWYLSSVCLMTCEGVGADTKLDGGGDVRETRLDEEFDLGE